MLIYILYSVLLFTVGLSVFFAQRWWLMRRCGFVIDSIRSGHISSDEVWGKGIAGRLGRAVVEVFSKHNKQFAELETKLQETRIQMQLMQRQRNHIEAIIYSISDVVLVTDSEDRLLMANEPAGRLFGFDIRTCRHRRISELLNDGEMAELISQTRRSEVTSVRREWSRDFEDKQEVYEALLSTVRDSDDRIGGIVAVLHDVTREKEIAQMKNEFVSHVSHELKTPLASISAYAEMLVDGEANDEQTRAQFYDVIQSQAERLNRLIEDILNISRIESGLVKVNKGPVSLAVIGREGIDMIRSYAGEKDIEIIDKSPIVYDQVFGDRDMLSQVVVNLLSNAVKYTTQGGKVTVSTDVDESEQIVRFSVTDTGVGIPEEDVERVFDKFYRVQANNKVARGTGLGLNLVKQIVENVHEGRVFVTSIQGRGSTFGFEMPMSVGTVKETSKV